MFIIKALTVQLKADKRTVIIVLTFLTPLFFYVGEGLRVVYLRKAERENKGRMQIMTNKIKIEKCQDKMVYVWDSNF